VSKWLADRSPYGVAVALLIAGLALTGVLLAQAIKAAPAAPVEIGMAATVRVDRTALTVFSSARDPRRTVASSPIPRAVPVTLRLRNELVRTITAL
jgi:hypothetical protein